MHSVIHYIIEIPIIKGAKPIFIANMCIHISQSSWCLLVETMSGLKAPIGSLICSRSVTRCFPWVNDGHGGGVT